MFRGGIHGRALSIRFDSQPLIICPSCTVSMELLEDMNPIFNRRVYGCQKCDSVFDFRAVTSCMDPGGLTKRTESLTEYRYKIADRTQAGIRSERQRIEAELARLKSERDVIDEKIKEQEDDLKQLQTTGCKHPNRKSVSSGSHDFCPDCGRHDLEYR